SQSHTQRSGPAVILSLDGKLLASVVEAEDFVGDVQQLSEELDPVPEPVTQLSVQLSPRVEVSISVRTGEAAICSILKVVRKDAGTVVRGCDPPRKAPAVVAESEIPGLRSLALERGLVGPTGHRRFRVGIGVIRQDPDAAQHSRQEGEM